MPASLRILSIAAFLIADATLLTGTTKAADIVGEPSSNARIRHYRWAAPSMFVAGVRGATPLTVPFFGSNWYPGPVYYRPPPRSCICGREDAVISVRY
jgi:hypothetical protein